MDEENLISCFNEGREDAYRVIFDTYYWLLVGFAVKILHDQQDAEDIVSESFITAFESTNSFENIGYLRGFLYTTVRNKAFNALKSNKRRLVRDYTFCEYIQDDTILEYEHSIKAQIIIAIHERIEKLPDKCKEIFKMHAFESIEPALIAKTLNISPNTVYVQIHRAMIALKGVNYNKTEE